MEKGLICKTIIIVGVKISVFAFFVVTLPPETLMMES